MALGVSAFQKLLFAWFHQHGRKQLPWQHNKTPYRVWISEIMLQQTQVSTVIPYYERFMQRFPDLMTLANATEDEVLHLWAGLGYYRRARHLHRAAQMIRDDHQGQFPDTLIEITALPGIGRSTAGAILAIAFEQKAAILDGNVKRVLTRIHGILDPIKEKATENTLWHLAEKYTPVKQIADYTQAIMDLGATLCTRSQPRCEACPFDKHCVAHKQNIVDLLPKKTALKKRPRRSATFLIIKKQHRILLQKRPPTGIWGGLWSLPEIVGEPEIKTLRRFCTRHFQLTLIAFETLPPCKHTFSHYHLDIFPVLIEVTAWPLRVMEAEQQIWYNLKKPESLGLPKPIQRLLEKLA